MEEFCRICLQDDGGIRQRRCIVLFPQFSADDYREKAGRGEPDLLSAELFKVLSVHQNRPRKERKAVDVRLPCLRCLLPEPGKAVGVADAAAHEDIIQLLRDVKWTFVFEGMDGKVQGADPLLCLRDAVLKLCLLNSDRI